MKTLKSLDLILDHLEEMLAPYRSLSPLKGPRKGWIKAIQQALGMTNVQLAKRAGRQPQTIEGIQAKEIAGTIRLRTLQEIAEHLDARLIYAIVPNKPLHRIREEQAKRVARTFQKMAAHSMNLEAQGVSQEAEEREFTRLVSELLAGDPKKLWR